MNTHPEHPQEPHNDVTHHAAQDSPQARPEDAVDRDSAYGPHTALSYRSQADRYIAHLVDTATSFASSEAIRLAYQRHGIPFAVYAAIEPDRLDERAAQPSTRSSGTRNTDGTDGNRAELNDEPSGQGSAIEDDFREAFVGYYPNRAALVEDTSSVFGWQAELDRALADEPTLRSVVSLDHDKVYAFVADRFEVTILPGRETNSGYYLFLLPGDPRAGRTTDTNTDGLNMPDNASSGEGQPS